MNKLAIIIPAYKSKYLRETLNSFANQSNKDFKVYVGDDASQENIQNIVNDFIDIIDLEYFRFDNNLGKKNLVKQWKRTIELSDEKWVWLFSDDDIVDSNCVEEFYKELNKGKVDIYRFNNDIIDGSGNINKIKDNPTFESSENLALRLLDGELRTAGINYIFSRDIYNKYSIKEFPLAWGSDHYIGLQFSKMSGIKTIPNSRVYFRWSGINISSQYNPEINYIKLKSNIMFFHWQNRNILPPNQEIIKKETQLIFKQIKHKSIKFKDLIFLMIRLSLLTYKIRTNLSFLIGQVKLRIK